MLPALIPRRDAIFNLQRMALFLQALHNEDFSLLREAVRDRWHQPFRQHLVPGLECALSLEHPDLLGVCLSGSGPSVLAMARTNLHAVAAAFSEAYRRAGIAHQVRLLRAHHFDTEPVAEQLPLQPLPDAGLDSVQAS